MAQKWIIPREIVKTKVAQREKVIELENTINTLNQKVTNIEKSKETSK